MNHKKVKKKAKAVAKVHVIEDKLCLTSNSGIVPVGQFFKSLNFDKLFLNHVDMKIPSNATYDLNQALFLSVVGVVAGARSLSAILKVWSSPVLQRIFSVNEIPHESTLGRIFKCNGGLKIDSQMTTFIHKCRELVWAHACRKKTSLVGTKNMITVDTDSTVKTVYGSQEGTEKGYNPHKRGAKSYHPLLAFCAETKEILQGWLRCGDVHTAHGIIEFTKELLAQMQEQQKIFFRADSGFFQGDLLDLLEAGGHDYLIKVKMRGLEKLLVGQKWEKVPNQPEWEQCQFEYKCRTWLKERTFVAVRRIDKKRMRKEKEESQEQLFDLTYYDNFCYVVRGELCKKACWSVHKEYGKRATSETWIEEAKNQMGLAQIKTKDFWANALIFQVCVIAYNLLRWMALCSREKNLMKWEPETIRTYLIRQGGRLLTGSRKLILKYAKNELYEKESREWFQLGIP